MFDIPLFKAEKECGFTSQSLAKASISYLAKIEALSNFDSSKVEKRIIDECKIVAALEEQDVLLFPFKAILVSTTWNGNDDVFHPYEVWSARNTVKDKRLNLEHDENDIIGHTTSSLTIDNEGNVLDDSTTLDELPEKYHILSNSVIYKNWSNKEKRDRVNKIIEEIPLDKWFVSVEALFSSFDYAILDEQGTFKLIARTEETSFLTKHLRCYGGKGVYEGSKVGRVPRNLVFSGKGIVKVPANPDSIILAKKYDFVMQNKNMGYDIQVNNNKTKEAQMEQELKNEIAKLQEANQKLQASLAEINVKDFKTQIETLNNELKAKQENLVSTDSLLKTAREELKSAIDKVAEVEKQRDELKSKFDKLEADKKYTDRISLVVSKLKLDEAKAKKLVDSLSILSDEAFASNIEIQTELVSAKVEKVEEVKKVSDSKKADEKVLEDVEKKVEANLTVTSTDDGVETLRASVVDYLGSFLNTDK